MIVIEPVAWNEIFDRPELTHPPLSAEYVNLPFSCAPLNRPLVTVPVTAWVVTGLPGTSVSLIVTVEVFPLFQEITSVALIAGVGGVASVVQFLGAPWRS